MRFAALIAAGVAFLPGLAISTKAGAGDLVPNLRPLKASEIRIVTTSSGRKLLRFSATNWNSGDGPLELIGGEVDSATSKQKVYQRLYSSDGTYRDIYAGSFDWHEAHNHMHFNDFALYDLQSVSNPNSHRYAQETTFCVMDTTKINGVLLGAPASAVYTTCGASKQGMSIGWGDKYGYKLTGQSIDITSVANGEYYLKIRVDSKRRLLEKNDSDNLSSRKIRISGTTVTLLN
jgi:hypothetical protein